MHPPNCGPKTHFTKEFSYEINVIQNKKKDFPIILVISGMLMKLPRV